MQTYVDGALVNENSDPSGDTTPSTSALTIARHPIDAAFFAGALDDVRIYDRALAATELTTLAQHVIDSDPERSSEKQTNEETSPMYMSTGCSATNSSAWAMILIGLAARRRQPTNVGCPRSS